MSCKTVVPDRRRMHTSFRSGRGVNHDCHVQALAEKLAEKLQENVQASDFPDLQPSSLRGCDDKARLQTLGSHCPCKKPELSRGPGNIDCVSGDAVSKFNRI